MLEIEPPTSTTALTSEGIPDPNGPLEPTEEGELPELIRFAFSIDAAALPSTQMLELFASALRERWERADDESGAKEFPVGIELDALRWALNYEGHHWRHHAGDHRGGWARGHPEHAEFFRALVAELNKLIYQEESWWWEPDHEPSDDERLQRALARSRERGPLVRLYDETWSHLEEVISTYEDGLPDDDKTLLEVLDPPIVEEPDPVRYARQQTVQRLAIAFFMQAEGEGFGRARNASQAALDASAALGPL